MLKSKIISIFVLIIRSGGRDGFRRGTATPVTVVQVHPRTLKRKTMFQIFIQGWGSDDVQDIAGFDECGEDFICLFVGYTEGEIKVGNTIRIGDVDLKVVEASLGFGENVYTVPIGYKSVLMVRGKTEDVHALKVVLEEVTKWNQSKEDTSAAVIND